MSSSHEQNPEQAPKWPQSVRGERSSSDLRSVKGFVRNQPWNSFNSLYIRTTKKQAQRKWPRSTCPAKLTAHFCLSSPKLALLHPDKNRRIQPADGRRPAGWIRVSPALCSEHVQLHDFQIKPKLRVGEFSQYQRTGWRSAAVRVQSWS